MAMGNTGYPLRKFSRSFPGPWKNIPGFCGNSILSVKHAKRLTFLSLNTAVCWQERPFSLDNHWFWNKCILDNNVELALNPSYLFGQA